MFRFLSTFDLFPAALGTFSVLIVVFLVYYLPAHSAYLRRVCILYGTYHTSPFFRSTNIFPSPTLPSSSPTHTRYLLPFITVLFFDVPSSRNKLSSFRHSVSQAPKIRRLRPSMSNTTSARCRSRQTQAQVPRPKGKSDILPTPPPLHLHLPADLQVLQAFRYLRRRRRCHLPPPHVLLVAGQHHRQRHAPSPLQVCLLVPRLRRRHLAL
ncbi:hypothetical protein R3P38DRAFT_1329012 [Favolaschia claudopus]|uniref:Uncharacterized protein n=1 Tax=Favolaschia claudopus TaxID=2862362 RepID=A0AAW0AX95_9AGAR